MDKKEFDRIVDEAVAAGAERSAAEQYVIDGFKIGPDEAAKLVSKTAKPAKPATKAKAKK